MSPKADAYEVVTRRIIEALEQGVVPWHKPWKNVRGVGPTSMSTGKEYRGINVWILAVEQMLKGYSSPYWLTFKQAKERGGSVRKGEEGTQIVLWKPFKKKVEKDGQEREERFLMLRYFTVFNVDQCDGIEAPAIEEIPERDPIETAEAIVQSYVGRPEVKHGGNRAYYSPALDYIQMPKTGQFHDAEGYYATLFHELAHSTGHESRLARKSLISPTPFGTPDYSREELVAELAAAFVCGEAGIPVNVEQSAAYLQSWLKVLKDDRKMLVQAAAQAQKAADLMQGIEAVKEGSSSDDSPTVNHKEESWEAFAHSSHASTTRRSSLPRPATISRTWRVTSSEPVSATAAATPPTRSRCA
jgi:antirestriction protein ArdC